MTERSPHMTALHEKQLVEIRREGADYSIDVLLITRDLSEAEQDVLSAIVGFQHAFPQPATLKNIYDNIRETPEESIPVLLVQLARKG